MSDYEWMKQAACRGVEDAMWDENIPAPEATRFCFACPVMRECADYGLARPHASDAGVLGGLGLYDRQRVRTGQVPLEAMWEVRLSELVSHDWDEALSEDFARTMPRLELV